MLDNMFTLPSKHKGVFWVLIPLLSFALCYIIFPIILKDFYGDAIPSYELLDLVIVSRNLFWLFETMVFFIILWVFNWKIKLIYRYFLMIFNFLISWGATIVDFRTPSIGIIAGTRFMCSFNFLLVPCVKFFLKNVLKN